MGLLPPVVATLLADTKEYSAKMDESIAKMDMLGKTSKSTGEKMGAFANKASTAVLGLGVALGGYALDKAYTFQEGLDKIQNQAGITATAARRLGDAILSISAATGITTPDLIQAGLAAEQAGIRGVRAQQLLSAASKASVITGTSAVDVTKALVAAETLHIAKVMSINSLTGLMIAGSRQIVGGFGAEAQMFQGRVGVALASVGLKMKDIIAAGAEFSKVGLNSRAVTSFATGVAKLELPLTTVHVTAKKTYTTLSTYALALKAVGLSQQKLVSDMRTGGLPALLNDIKDSAAGSLPKLQELLHVVFGTGAGTSQVLINNLKQFEQVQKSLTGAGAGTLKSGFAGAMKQLGPEMHRMLAEFNVFAVKFGSMALPFVQKLLTGASQMVEYFKAHPLVQKIASDATMAIFALALGQKILGVLTPVLAVLGVSMPELAAVAAAAGAITYLATKRSKKTPSWDPLNVAKDIFSPLVRAVEDLTKGSNGGKTPPHRGQAYGPTRPGGSAHWHVRITR